MASDQTIWDYAKANGFVIVSADSDFVDLALDRGARPKVIQLEKCNYWTARVEDLIRRNAVRITELEQSSRALLIIRNTS